MGSDDRIQQAQNEVLERAASLFGNEPDLLREFAHFLPPTTRDSAKMRIPGIAATNKVFAHLILSLLNQNFSQNIIN